MSPDERHAVGAIARLRREIAHDRAALAVHDNDAIAVATRWSELTPRGDLALAAVALHGWYTALEAIMERVVRTLDGSVPSRVAWHRDLLFQATAEVPRIRPPILPPALTDPLLELLAFRHFFRHGYAVALDPMRLQRNLTRLAEIRSITGSALDTFDEFLASASAATGADPNS